jgi:hypothetical protein
MRSVLKQIAWVCLLLTLLSAYSIVTHQHSSSENEAQCPVCVIAHSASPAVAPSLPGAILVLVLLLILAEPVPAKQRLVPSALTVRPPPVV